MSYDEKQIHDILWDAAQELGGSWEESRRRMPKDEESARALLQKAIESIQENVALGEYEDEAECDETVEQMDDLQAYLADYGEEYFRNN